MLYLVLVAECLKDAGDSGLGTQDQVGVARVGCLGITVLNTGQHLGLLNPV